MKTIDTRGPSGPAAPRPSAQDAKTTNLVGGDGVAACARPRPRPGWLVGLALITAALVLPACGETEPAQEICLPGMRRTQDCGTGPRRRMCADDGRPETAESCLAEDGELPFDPQTSLPIYGRYVRPIVFFTPHPDDESIGMAGAIREAVSQGRSVFIEVMTHGEKSRARGTLNDHGTDSWHLGAHDEDLTEDAFGDARVREVMDAAARLGVTGVRVHSFRNGELTASDVSEQIQYWTGRQASDPGEVGLSLRGTAGFQDPRDEDGKPHPDHAAVWDALAASGVDDIEGYCIYAFTSAHGMPQETRDISPWCADKNQALAAYGVWDPGNLRFAVGFHSVHKLIEKAGSDCQELVVRRDSMKSAALHPMKGNSP